MTKPAGKLLLFITLSAADFLLTWGLVRQEQGGIYEGNPVAGWWLATFGWVGLAVFKALTVLLVSSLALLLYHSRPWYGGLVLNVACSSVSVVLFYSCYLQAWGAAPPQEVARLTAENERLEVELQRTRAYQDLVEQLAADLACRRCRLGDAAERLCASDKGRDPAWRRRLCKLFPCCSDREALAASLMLACVARHSRDRGRREMALRLEAEFQTDFGTPLPGGPWPVGLWSCASRKG